VSQKNIEIVRSAIEAASRRPEPDWRRVNELYDPAHELHSLIETMEGGHATGWRGGRDLIARMDETGEWSVTGFEDIREGTDGRVAALVQLQMRSKLGDVPLEWSRASVLTLREGKICRTVFYATWGETLKAAGLEA
jgi:hypothetical protein